MIKTALLSVLLISSPTELIEEDFNGEDFNFLTFNLSQEVNENGDSEPTYEELWEREGLEIKRDGGSKSEPSTEQREPDGRGKGEPQERDEVQQESSVPEPIEEPKPSSPAPQTIVAEFTFYTAQCNGCTGLTAYGGHDVRNTIYVGGNRVIAVDPNVIPPYSVVEFTLNGERVTATALDRGGDIKGNRIDLLVSSKEEALQLGRRTIEVDIVSRGD